MHTRRMSGVRPLAPRPRCVNNSSNNNDDDDDDDDADAGVTDLRDVCRWIPAPDAIAAAGGGEDGPAAAANDEGSGGVDAGADAGAAAVPTWGGSGSLARRYCRVCMCVCVSVCLCVCVSVYV